MQKAIEDFVRTLISRGLSKLTITAYKSDLLQLEEFLLRYFEDEKIDVPWSHPDRKEVYEVSGQTTVPVLVDGDTMLADEYEIIDYLKKTYPVNS